MTVVYYTDQIYKHGGLERVIANKLNYFSNHTNLELHVITFQQEQQPPCYSIPQSVALHDLDINYNRQKSFLHPTNIKYVVPHYKRLKKALRTIKPDIIVVCNYEFGFYMIPFLAKQAITVKEYHSSRYFNHQQRLQTKNFLKKINYRILDYVESKYDHLVLLTKDELPYYHNRNKIIIPNSIDHISTAQARLDQKRVIAAGRIAPVKGFELLIKAWQEIQHQYPDWCLDIYGDGEPIYMATLQAQIDDLKLSNTITLKGPTTDLKKIMCNTSIYAMSSLTECFPMVLLEAMSYGLPIVSFDCPNGPRNIISHDKDGLLVPYLDVQALAKNIITLIDDEPRRKALGEQAQVNVMQFTHENIMPKWLNLFKIKN